MKADIRCVVDTNVLISAVLLPNRTPYNAVRRVFEVGVLCQSAEMLSELRSRIHRKKFDPYLRDTDRNHFFEFVVEHSVLVETRAIRVAASRDPDDNKVLELALAAQADVIVTGDEDLRELHPFRGIPILNPRAFLDWVEV